MTMIWIVPVGQEGTLTDTTELYEWLFRCTKVPNSVKEWYRISKFHILRGL